MKWISLILLCMLSNMLEAQNLEKAVQFGGENNEIASEMVTTDGNNLYLAYTFKDVTIIDGEALESIGEEDVLLVKYDILNDTILWYLHLGSVLGDEITALTVDPNGDIVIGGTFWFELDIGSIQLSTEFSSKGLFLTKITGEGVPLWAQKMEGSGISELIDLQADGNNDILLTAFFEGEMNLLDTFLLAVDQTASLLAKTTSNGDLDWIVAIDGTGRNQSKALAISETNNVVLTGIFDGRTIIQQDTIAANSNDEDIFLAQFTQEGSYQWLVKAGGVFDDQPGDLKFDEEGNVWLTGSFVGVMESEPDLRLESLGGNPDAFILKFDQDGNTLMGTSFGGSLIQSPISMSSKFEQIHLAGLYRGEWKAGTFAFDAESNGNLGFYLKLDAEQNPIEAISLQSEAGNIFISDLIGLTENKILLLGTFDADIRFSDQTILSTTGGQDLFLLKFDLGGTTSSNSLIPGNIKKMGLIPNPTTGIITLQIPNGEIQKIIIYDILGNHLLSTENTDKIDLTFFPTGEYFVSVITPLGEIFTEKIVKY